MYSLSEYRSVRLGMVGCSGTFLRKSFGFVELRGGCFVDAQQKLPVIGEYPKDSGKVLDLAKVRDKLVEIFGERSLKAYDIYELLDLCKSLGRLWELNFNLSKCSWGVRRKVDISDIGVVDLLKCLSHLICVDDITGEPYFSLVNDDSGDIVSSPYKSAFFNCKPVGDSESNLKSLFNSFFDDQSGCWAQRCLDVEYPPAEVACLFNGELVPVHVWFDKLYMFANYGGIRVGDSYKRKPFFFGTASELTEFLYSLSRMDLLILWSGITGLKYSLDAGYNERQRASFISSWLMLRDSKGLGSFIRKCVRNTIVRCTMFLDRSSTDFTLYPEQLFNRGCVCVPNSGGAFNVYVTSYLMGTSSEYVDLGLDGVGDGQFEMFRSWIDHWNYWDFEALFYDRLGFSHWNDFWVQMYTLKSQSKDFQKVSWNSPWLLGLHALSEDKVHNYDFSACMREDAPWMELVYGPSHSYLPDLLRAFAEDSDVVDDIEVIFSRWSKTFGLFDFRGIVGLDCIAGMCRGVSLKEANIEVGALVHWRDLVSVYSACGFTDAEDFRLYGVMIVAEPDIDLRAFHWIQRALGLEATDYPGGTTLMRGKWGVLCCSGVNCIEYLQLLRQRHKDDITLAEYGKQVGHQYLEHVYVDGFVYETHLPRIRAYGMYRFDDLLCVSTDIGVLRRDSVDVYYYLAGSIAEWESSYGREVVWVSVGKGMMLGDITDEVVHNCGF